jgi:hypothetical protein
VKATVIKFPFTLFKQLEENLPLFIVRNVPAKGIKYFRS